MSKSIPVIDLSDFGAHKNEIREQLITAAVDVGFFVVVGHGIPQNLIDEQFSIAKRFFQLPDDIKAKYSMPKGRNAGWEKMAQVRPSTGTNDLKESIQINYHDMEGLWPTEEDCEGFRSKSREFMTAAHEVSMKILSCFALSLGFEEHFFEPHHDPAQLDNQQCLRCLYYHDCTGQKYPSNFWRAGAHTDFDTLTLLFQKEGEAGLEVCPGREASTDFAMGDVWTPVDPMKGGIVINIGDMLMRWSDDKLKSNFHRVRVPKEGDEYTGPRQSLAYFNQANKSSVIQGPLQKYPPLTGGDFIQQALDRNFAAIQVQKAMHTTSASNSVEIMGTAAA
ncbi:hypothetical protein CEUSTIGMA_g8665.t1 [Chlamydomonas eustigma]|uniref:Fe2OG dioxygenase domain-containing protein n=1 Tax=Chlamydomonas eustigma TaxID=1157962 RepID=A0A250XDR1_9CHLO|nr:hypothetical protein CEUSTIGMA_g8665.t1 [Chlamydomonas eustigma]|eukprot:GAX81233.1 hypothetical protein CEUSTIGMA_g8665.t1 [Chlamydomonas eustigma]